MLIPEAAGATPTGIFQLADEYLHAARSIPHGGVHHTGAPDRLLAFHACELFLKTYLRSHGEMVKQLRDYGHDLAAMLDAAKARGLKPSPNIEAKVDLARRGHDYVRIRYLVVNAPNMMRPDTVIDLAEAIRECVRSALNMDEFGVPHGEAWAAPLPRDHRER